MLEVHTIIDDIQNAIYTEGTVDPDLLRDTAAQYSETCAATNVRLRKAVQLLHQGLRGEALQYVEADPNLLDMVAQLDFPEASEWGQMLTQWEMDAPPSLLIDMAAELNEAYADQAPLQMVLRKHRLLALARAPLAARISVTRKICAMDPRNTIWREDVEILEKARLKEIRLAAKKASSSSDLPTLSQLSNELADNGWTAAGVSEVSQYVCGFCRTALVKHARQTLEKLEPQLTSAYSEFDVDRGRQLRNEWNKHADIVQLRPEDPLAELVAPALAWLGEQDQITAHKQEYDQAVRSLEQAMDDGLSAKALEMLRHAAVRHGDGLPDVLERRYRSYITALQLAARRKHRVALVGVVCVILAVGITAGAILHQQSHQRAVTASCETMQTLINEEHLEEAGNYYDELTQSLPSVAQNAKVQQEKARLDGLLVDEQERQKAFETAIAQAEASGVDKPDLAALEQASQQAKTTAEKARFSRLESAVSAAKQERQRQRDIAFQKILDAFRQRVAQLKSQVDLGQASDGQAVLQLRSELRAAISASENVSQALHEQATPLIVRLDTMNKEIQTLRDQERIRDKMTEAVGDSSRYLAALQEFGNRYPEAASASAYKQAASEVQLWKDLDAWSAFLSKPEFRNLKTLSPAVAAVLIKTGDKLVVDHPGVPSTDIYRKKMPHLKAVAARNQDMKSQIKDLFHDPAIANLWMIGMKDGKRYYLRNKPEFIGSPPRIKHVVDYDMTEKTQSFSGDDNSRDNIVYESRAPQSLVAGRAISKLKLLSDATWEKTFYQILQEIHEQPDMDPVLKMTMLKSVLDTATKGSASLADAFGRYKTKIDESDVDLSVSWLSPKDKSAEEERSRAKALFARLPAPKEMIQDASVRLREFHEPPMRSCLCIGWLGRDKQGAWKCHRRKSASIDGELVILHQATGSQTAEFVVIGTIDSDAITWKTTRSDVLLEGRPLYVRPAAN